MVKLLLLSKNNQLNTIRSYLLLKLIHYETAGESKLIYIFLVTVSKAEIYHLGQSQVREELLTYQL
jgi:hypothetical protein